MNADLTNRIDAWLAAAVDDAECKAAIPRLTVVIRLSFGDMERTLNLPAVEFDTALRVDIGIRAPMAVWAEILTPVPAPGYQSFTALQRQCDDFEVIATTKDVARSLHVLERLMELAHGNPQDAQGYEPPSEDGLKKITGHHRIVSTPTSSARIFHEQTGEGPPLVMLHTAGADSRQFLEIMCDDRLVENWSCYAFDMPLHGCSSPKQGWQWDEYQLTMKDYLDWTLAFIDQVVGQPAVVMGCSMGACIGIALAASGSPLVRAIVALGAPDRSPGRRNPCLQHPAVDGADYRGAYVRGLMSPTSSLNSRRHASWIYAQGGPGVYPGDLWFYSEEYDGMALAPAIDTQRCPVHLLTGAYDYSAPPEASRRLQQAIPGATLTVMPELGHFPMIENPERFLDYALPVLQTLHETGVTG